MELARSGHILASVIRVSLGIFTSRRKHRHRHRHIYKHRHRHRHIYKHIYTHIYKHSSVFTSRRKRTVARSMGVATWSDVNMHFLK
jgi:hypothetical protein